MTHPTFQHEAMATYFEIIIAGHEHEYARQASAAAFRELDRLENTLSRFIEFSDISRANRLARGESTTIGHDTLECLLIAADVLYERHNADALATLIPRLAAPDGRVLLADPGRTYLEHFRELMRGAGWRVEESGRRSEPVPETGREVTVRLYSLWRGLPPVIGPRRNCRRS